MDVVYVVGDYGGRWECKELVYSIRSLVNIEFDNIWIVGKKPMWFNNKIKHYNIKDIYPNKTSNVIRKILKICNNNHISEDFILMNDDFLFMTPQEIQSYTWGDLEDLWPTKRGKYKQSLIRSIEICKLLNIPTKNYEVHYPMIINKTKFMRIFDNINWVSNPPCYRSIYGNYYNIEAEEIVEDFKAYNDKDWFKLKNGSFISLNDDTVLYKKVAEDIPKIFNTRSIYEKDLSYSCIRGKNEDKL